MRKNGAMTNGKFEGLMHISDDRNLFTMVATDQRGSLKRMINPDNPNSVSAEEMKRVKLSLIKNLAGRGVPSKASGILVDPEFSVERSFIEACGIRADVGILISLEASGYGGRGELAPKVRIFGGLGVEEAVGRIKGMGASAVKMLVYYRKDSPTHGYQESMVMRAGEMCAKYDIPFLLECLSHPLEDGPHPKKNPVEFSGIKSKIVIEAAEELTKPEYGVDVLKAEFPLNLKYAEELGQDPAEACKQLDEASQVPWVVLSAGVDYEEFKENVRYATENGASGFLCGRAIWKEAVGRRDMDNFIQTTGIKRLSELAAMVGKKAKPWYKKHVGSLGDIELIRGK